jgi:hypothetical protein
MKVAAAKSDSRVTDTEKFLLPTYQRQPFVLERGKGSYGRHQFITVAIPIVLASQGHKNTMLR